MGEHSLAFVLKVSGPDRLGTSTLVPDDLCALRFSLGFL